MDRDYVMGFQRDHFDWNGTPLLVDGLVGPKTTWAMAIAQCDRRRQEIVARACSCVGIAEVGGANRGPDIDVWVTRAGAPLGSPWCAAAASWWLSVEGMPTIREAGARSLGLSFPPIDWPEPADLMWFPTGTWQAHCGIVIGCDLDRVACVEGNHGNAVRIAVRHMTQVRFSRTVSMASAPVPTGFPLIATRAEGTR